MKLYFKILIILPALLFFAYSAYHLNMTQDDSFISYRYVQNFLDGKGLVFNIGEKVEGFTHFGWVVYLILWGKLGLDIILVSKITGFIFGLGILLLTFFLSMKYFENSPEWLSLLPVYLMAAFLPLAYWAPSGLATVPFAFLVLLSLYWAVESNYLLIFSLAAAVWLRPEGAWLAGLLIVAEAIIKRNWPKFTFKCALAAFIFSLPMLAFKYFYYGGILPNPFYAKTDFGWQQILNGIEYFKRFVGHYPFVVIAYVIPLLFYTKLSNGLKYTWWLLVGFTFYVVLVGGDVLHAHRFMVPLIGLLALLTVYSFYVLFQRLRGFMRVVLILAFTAVSIFAALYLPYEYIKFYDGRERGLVILMENLADNMKKSDPRPFSAAISTIGAFSYHLPGHRIIDMLGLTDTTIARHPETNSEEMVSTWKERRYNIGYLLAEAPDYIVFSTGTKPSAPAEKALIRYPQFLQSYRVVSWPAQVTGDDARNLTLSAYKKMHPIVGKPTPVYDTAYVDDYQEGIHHTAQRRYKLALEWFRKARREEPRVFNPNLLYHEAYSLRALGDIRGAKSLLDSIVAVDSTVSQAQKDLYLIESYLGNTDKAQVHREWLLKLTPWFVPVLDNYMKTSMPKK